MKDVQVGDSIKYLYEMYGTQIIGAGVITEVDDDFVVIEDLYGKEIEVPYDSIYTREPRASEIKPVQIQEEPSEEDRLNEGVQGVHIRVKKNKKGKLEDD